MSSNYNLLITNNKILISIKKNSMRIPFGYMMKQKRR